MEIIAQWLDDLDDFVSAFGLVGERLRTLMFAAIALGTLVCLEAAAVYIALRHPPLASAIATMLVVYLLYRSATAPRMVVQQVG